MKKLIVIALLLVSVSCSQSTEPIISNISGRYQDSNGTMILLLVQKGNTVDGTIEMNGTAGNIKGTFDNTYQQAILAGSIGVFPITLDLFYGKDKSLKGWSNYNYQGSIAIAFNFENSL